MTKGILSKPLCRIETDPKKGKRIIISGSVALGAKETRGIDIRKYFNDQNGESTPTKKGIFLTANELSAIISELGFDPDGLDSRFKNFLFQEKKPMLTIE